MRNALTTSSTLVTGDVLQNSFGSSRSALRQLAMIVAATGFVALCAHISIALPFTVVPLTLQTFAVVLLGMVMGPTAGFAALALYLAEGAAGLPVFSPHGIGGTAQLLGPTGGYLFAYPFAAALAGAAVRRLTVVRSLLVRATLAGTLATVVILALGAAWLAMEVHLHTPAAWAMGIAPFLPGETLKIAAAAGIFATLERWKRA